MSAVFIAFLFISIFGGAQRYVDPYLVAKVVSGDVGSSERLWVVEMKDVNLRLAPGYYQITPYASFQKIPVVYTKQVDSGFLKCVIENVLDPSKCLADDMIYVRYPRKLKPLSANLEFLRLVTKIAEIDREIRASEARKFFGVSGKKVVVGIVDTGMRWSSKYLLHKFKDAREDIKHNFSKAIRIWDQELVPTFLSSLTYPEGFTYGIECKEPSVLVKDVCPSKDDSGHGTQIVGIISLEGENGEEGIAPDSPLVVIRSTLIEPDVVDAVRYIFSVARNLGTPAVVNISLGGHFGPHDGTSLFEVLLRQELGPGRIIVAAAGNEGNKSVHVRGEFSGERYFSVKVLDECEVQMWFPVDSVSSIRVSFAGKVGEVSKNNIVFLFSEEKKTAALYFGDGVDLPANLKYSFPRERVKDGAVFAAVGFSGERAEFKITPTKRILFDAWISSDDRNCYFETATINSGSYLNPVLEGTVSVPGTSPDIIAVGSYSISSSRKGNISRFSSVGDNPSKPNITAPGEVVYSVCNFIEEELCPGSGTSHSTPQVSGAIALALERNPILTPQDVIRLLCESARRDEFTGETPNNRWGCGKLDVFEFLSRVPYYQSSFAMEYNVNHYLEDERLEGKLFTTLTVESSFPFKVYGGDFYDLGWGTKRKFFLRRVPERIDVEFLNGYFISRQVSPQGFRGCGCIISGESPYISFLAHFALLFFAYCLIRIRLRCRESDDS